MATVEFVGVFLAKLGMLCTSNMSEDEALARIEEYTPMLCAEFDNSLFSSADCLAYVAKLCKFFPGYGELCGHLTEWRRDTTPFRPALPAPVEAPRIPPTDEEKAVISALTRKAVAAIADVAAADVVEKPKITPAYLSDGRLLAECEASIVKYAGGQPGTMEGAFLDLAIMRRDGLRKKLGITIEHDERALEFAQ